MDEFEIDPFTVAYAEVTSKADTFKLAQKIRVLIRATQHFAKLEPELPDEWITLQIMEDVLRPYLAKDDLD